MDILRNANAILLILSLTVQLTRAQVEDLLIKAYDKSTLSYTFTETRFLNNGKRAYGFQGEVSSLRRSHDIQYVMSYSSTDKPSYKYVSIKNRKYFGCNILGKSHYEDYKLEKRPTHFFFDGNHPKHIFYPSKTQPELFNDTGYTVSWKELPDYWLLELNWHDQKGGQTLKKYFVDKKDHRIKRSSSYNTSSIDNVVSIDSTVYTYQYIQQSKGEIMKKISSFKPLGPKAQLPQDSANKDTLRIFPAFNLPDTSGIAYKSSQITAKLVLVEFWYKSCAPCLMNMANLESVRKEFKESDLEIIAINTMDKLDSDIKKIIFKLNKSYTFLFNGFDLIRASGVSSYPFTVIYDNSARNIVFRRIGTGKDYTRHITEFIKKRLAEVK